MESIEFMNTKNKIILFAVGCWNRGCTPEQKMVFDEIINKQNEADLLIIMGDNVYNNKSLYSKSEIEKSGLSEKNHQMEIYNKGIECLLGNTRSNSLRFNKQAFFVLGNHVLGNHDVSKNQEKCEIFMKQLKIHEIHKNLHTVYPYGTQDIIKKELHVKLIFIDTNFGDSNNYKDKSYVGYDGRHINKEEILNFLEEELKHSTADHNIVIGHHPFIGNKLKKGETDSVFIDALETIFEKYLYKKIIHLCADIHMYQAWDMNNKLGTLREIICGTGGASLDDKTDFPESFVFQSKDNIYKKLDQIEQLYGYVQLHFTKDRSEQKYIEIVKSK